MKDNILFSILIPTRNRLNLLKRAVNSVIQQNYKRWELIISDNCSDENIQAFIEEIDDNRIRYKRQDRVVSVTDNWNDANDMAHGEYIIMLGDDDALVPDALERLINVITKYNSLDLIAYAAYIYVQPKVDPQCPQGRLYMAQPFKNEEDKNYLSMEYRQQLVSNCCQFNERFGHNMQYYCYSRVLRDAVCKYGRFYEAPYPDYYTSCMMLLCANTAILISEVITIIGVTPKSYGYFYVNNIDKEGMKFHEESDYRDKAPSCIRGMLCSVDEMDTAAAATYALL